jgi:puromycin-sensitive aminopeptidase
VEITLEQTRFLSDGSIDESSPVWKIPLLFASNGSISEEAVIFSEKVQTFRIPLNASAAGDSWIKINAGQKALARVAHSPSMISRLHSAIQNKVLSPVDRAALLLDSYALAKGGLAPLENIVDILKVLVDEDSSIVWSALHGVLNGLYILLEQLNNEAVFTSYVAFGKKLVLHALDKVGWDAKETDGHTDKLLRATVLSLLDTFAWNDASVAAEAKRRFDAHWTDASALPSEYKGTVYKIVLMNGGKTEYDAILNSYNATEDNQIRKYAMFTLGSTHDEALKLKTLDWAVKSGDVKLQDFFYPIGSVASSYAGSLLTWKYFQENFETMKQMLVKASPSLFDAVIVNSVSRFCTADKADEIEKFFAVNPMPSSERRISQTIEVMRTSNQMLVAIANSSLADPAYWK